MSHTTPTAKPSNLLIEQQPIDTLVHIQSVLSLMQDYIQQPAEELLTSSNQSRVDNGHLMLLQLVNDALDYEIDRLGDSTYCVSPSPNEPSNNTPESGHYN